MLHESRLTGDDELSREKFCLIVTGAICVFGCAFLSIFNAVTANYTKAEIIPGSDYSTGIAVVSVSDGARESTVNINTASEAELASFLPGIGAVKAKRIVEYRKSAGQFVSVDELINVDGIGEKTLENIRPYCRISD